MTGTLVVISDRVYQKVDCMMGKMFKISKKLSVTLSTKALSFDIFLFPSNVLFLSYSNRNLNYWFVL